MLMINIVLERGGRYFFRFNISDDAKVYAFYKIKRTSKKYIL
mgnify:CR=1 FL=1